MALFQSLHHGQARASAGRKIQLAPANLHWCSDAALDGAGRAGRSLRRADAHASARDRLPEGIRASGAAAAPRVEYLDRFGMLGPRMTLGHGVWLNEDDIDRVAATGDLRLPQLLLQLPPALAASRRSTASRRRAINTAIGLDEAGINDDRDMLQEMRLVLRAHRVPGMDEDDVPSMAQVLRMATVGGARTTAFGDSLGTLEVGKGADLC